jgi:hypothetical protein
MITNQWVNEFEELCKLFEANKASMKDFDNDHLQFLIYWNFGYGQKEKAPETISAIAELTRRGETVNSKRAEELNELIEVVG